MRRNRGFTLMEIMIAMALAGIVTTSVLALVRTQLSTFEMNDQIMRTQQSARAAMDFLENSVRRACGGISGGSVAVNVPGATQQAVPCLRAYDGAALAAGSFTPSAPTTLPDAIEVVYATGTMTATTSQPVLTTQTPTLAVADVSQFSVNDFVLLTGSDFANGYLFKVSAITPANATTTPTAGTLSLGSLGANVVSPATPPTLKANMPVFKATTYSFFVVPTTGTGSSSTYGNMLMVDTNGVASAAHTTYNSASVQPLVEGVVDFQVAVGVDNTGDGVITDSASTTDEWLGNNASDSTLSGPPWFGTGQPKPRQVRLSLLLQTMNSYGGASPSITPFEDRTTYPSTSSSYNPRYRSAQIVVAPRGWNLSE